LLRTEAHSNDPDRNWPENLASDRKSNPEINAISEEFD
jgi:hypothetical protein